jgi:hypothetical protein
VEFLYAQDTLEERMAAEDWGTGMLSHPVLHHCRRSPLGVYITTSM